MKINFETVGKVGVKVTIPITQEFSKYKYSIGLVGIDHDVVYTISKVLSQKEKEEFKRYYLACDTRECIVQVNHPDPKEYNYIIYEKLLKYED